MAENGIIELTKVQRGLARHALGLSKGKRTSFRNYFVTGEKSADYQPWMDMVQMNAARRRKGSALTGGDDIFWLTEAGARAALDRDEKLDPKVFPHV
jgi:hypothetical protein